MSAQPSSHSSMLDLDYAGHTDPGRVRDHNEDYLGSVRPSTIVEGRTHGWLFALADGVGGQDQGEVASRTAIESVVEGFRSAVRGEALTALLPRLIQNANTAVYEAGRAASPGGVAMATTIVACALRYDRVVVAHVGDSRCYLLRQGHARLLTRDHTVAAEQLRMGLITARDAEAGQTRHQLSRSLGADLFVNVEMDDPPALPGAGLLLCSDGLHGPVEGSEMADIVRYSDRLEDAAHRLVSLASERDGSDNISVQLVRIRDVERVGMYRGRPYKLR